ncbi:MAG: EAL domain-containing protein [Limnoraphis sp.]
MNIWNFIQKKLDIYRKRFSKITKEESIDEVKNSLFMLLPDSLGIADFNGYFKQVNPAFESILGYTAGQLLAQPWIEYVHPDDQNATLQAFEQLLNQEPIINLENRFRCQDNSYIYLSWTAIADFENNLVYTTARDISTQKQTNIQLQSRVRQQSTVARLGQLALEKTIDVDKTNFLEQLFQQSVKMTAEILDVEYSKILQLLPDNHHFLIIAGVGWEVGLIETATIELGLNTQVGYTLLHNEPVIVENIKAETRFQGSSLLHEHEMISGMSVVIGSRKNPFGVLAVHSKKQRQFSTDDINFLQAIANILAMAVERHRSEEHLQLLERAINSANNGIIITDPNQPDNPIIYFNTAVEHSTGYPASEIMGKNCRFLQGKDRNQPEINIIRAAISAKKECNVVLRNYRKDGSLFWNELFISPVFNNKGKLTNFIGIQKDISERQAALHQRKRSEANLKKSQERLKKIVSAISDALIVININGLIKFVNLAAEVLFDRSESFLIGYPIGNFLLEEDKIELTIVQPKGKLVFVEIRSVEIDWEGEKATLVSLRDITERKQAEEQLRHSAFYDALTNLPNRALFMDQLEQAITQTKTLNQTSFAVVFLDLDSFKFVNESLGHIIGDQLLIAIADRLETCLRSGDILARLGGDEFTFLLKDIEQVSQAITVVQNIQHKLTFPFDLSSHQLFSNASLGIALISPDYTYPEEVLRDADIAMYSAKQRGKNCYAIFNSQMRKKSQHRLQLETDLRYAWEQQDFLVYYQPIVCLQTHQIVGFEALIRWQHLTKGLISPYQFIPVAEETGLIIELGSWVLKTACHQLKAWTRTNPRMQHLKMSVNLSSRQIQDYNFVKKINQVMTETQINPQNLKLEITESILMENPEDVKEKLIQIRSQNIQLSLDDFGTGYSSLSYLHNFPINTLKIDRSFIVRMNLNPENTAIVQAIITLAHTLGMDVIAEGIETVEHLKHLQALECEYGQGYLFSKPVSAIEADKLLESQQFWIE